MNILSCPSCLGILQLNVGLMHDDNIINGSLNCPNCKMNFAIEEGVPAFGLRIYDKAERINEIKAENEWTFIANSIQEHCLSAKLSSQKGIELIKKIESYDEKKSHLHLRKNILDIGSGWGCFQAWQFAKRGYNVIAAELCPEFIFASDIVAKECFFERIITDCTLLPFNNESFDIIFCKETLHHIDNPSLLLDEMWRVCKANGSIMIKEPCVSLLRNEPYISLLRKLSIAKQDRAGSIGIKHHMHSADTYIKLIKNITTDTVIAREAPTGLSQMKRQPFFEILNNLIISIMGCNLEAIGTKKTDYISNHLTNRELIPIEIGEIDSDLLKFYREKLIPVIFDLFKADYNGTI